MDSHGVPQKINRHVLKAVTYFMNQKNGSSFPEIYDYVKFCNKTLMPVSNLREMVRKSLNNLHRAGVLQKDRKKFKTQPGIKKKKTQGILKKKNAASSPSKESAQLDNTGKSRKRKNSDTSMESGSEENATKRRRGGMNKAMEQRKGKKADLPRAKRHQAGSSNVPINSASIGAANDSKVALDVQDGEDEKIPGGMSNEDGPLPEDEKIDDDENSNRKSFEASETSLSKQSGESGTSRSALDASQNPISNDPDNNSAIN